MEMKQIWRAEPLHSRRISRRFSSLVLIPLTAFSMTLTRSAQAESPALGSGEHSFANLGPEFSTEVRVAPVKGARLALFNFALARRLGLNLPKDPVALEKAILSAYAVMVNPKGSRSLLATRYQDSDGRTAGEALGDGRAGWSDEWVLPMADGRTISLDVVLKGVGQTPLAWLNHPDAGHKDGLQSMKEAIHSFIMSEANLRNRLDTTMDLAVIELPIQKLDKHTGEMNNAAITVRVGNQTRVAHLRYFRDKQDEFLKLLRYIVTRDLGLPAGSRLTENRVLGWLGNLTENLADEAARYYDLHAVHASPTSGNRTTLGSTIDLGTFRYLDAHHAEYGYLFDQLKLGGSHGQKEQLAGYIGEVISYVKESRTMKWSDDQFTAVKDALEVSFWAKFDAHLADLWLTRLGLNEAQRALVPFSTRKTLVAHFKKIYEERARAKTKVGDREMRMAAFTPREIFRESFTILAKSPVANVTDWQTLFSSRIPEEANSSRVSTLITAHLKLLAKVKAALVADQAIVVELGKRAQLVSSTQRILGGKENFEKTEAPILESLKKKQGTVETLSASALRAADSYVDHGLPARAKSQFGPETRVAILSGTFNPPHRGHEFIVENLIETLGADLVYVVTNLNAEHKSVDIDYAARLNMTRAAFEKFPAVRTNDSEIETAFKKGDRSAVISLLEQRHPNARLFHVMGSDSYERFRAIPKAKRANDTDVVVIDRNGKGSQASQGLEVFTTLPDHPGNFSSTKVRTDISKNGTSESLDPAVEKLITAGGYYSKRVSCKRALKAG